MKSFREQRTSFSVWDDVCALDLLLDLARNGLDVVAEALDFPNADSTSRTLEFLNFCSNGTTSLNAEVRLKDYSPSAEFFSFPIDWNFHKSWLNIDDLDDCDSLFDEFKDDLYVYPITLAPCEENSTDEHVSRVFVNSTYNYRANTGYIKCKERETEVLPLIQEPLLRRAREARDIMLNMTKAETIPEALVYAERLTGFIGDAINNVLLKETYSDRLHEHCYWVKDFTSQEVPYIDGSQEFFFDYDTEGGKNRENLRKKLDAMGRAYTKMYEHYNIITQNIRENLNRYLNGSMTKIELGEMLNQMAFVKSAEVLYGQNADLSSSIKEYITEMTLAKEIQIGIYGTFIPSILSIITPYNVHELELVEQSVALNDSRLQQIADSLKSDVTYLPELVAECYDRLMKSMEDVADGIIKPVEDVLEQLHELRQDLRIYTTSTEMDTDFFL